MKREKIKFYSNTQGIVYLINDNCKIIHLKQRKHEHISLELHKAMIRADRPVGFRYRFAQGNGLSSLNC